MKGNNAPAWCRLLIVVSVLLSLFRASFVAGAGETVSREPVTVYYFHSALRCDTCLFIERVAETTLQAEFPAELGKGSLFWHPLDRRLPENEQLSIKFGVTSNDLVVARGTPGKEREWESIPDLWAKASAPERLGHDLKEAVLRLLHRQN